MATGFPVKNNYATGDVLTAANMNDLSGTVNYLQYMPPRNAVLNSAFNVWQRGTSQSAAGGTNIYTDGNWGIYSPAATMTLSRQATSDTTNLPNIQYCARVQRNSGQTATNNVQFATSLETANSIPFAGKTITLSFYARAGANYSNAGNTLSAYIKSGTGTDQNYLKVAYTGEANVSSAGVTLTTTWQRFSITGTVSSSATELALLFVFQPSGTAGAADYYEITGVQLELGSVANPYFPNQPTYQGELAACQRYFYILKQDGTSTAANLAFGNAFSTTQTFHVLPLPVQMRVGPTATFSGTVSNYLVTAGNGSGVACTSVSYASSNLNMVSLYGTVASGLTLGQGSAFQLKASSSETIQFSSEL